MVSKTLWTTMAAPLISTVFISLCLPSLCYPQLENLNPFNISNDEYEVLNASIKEAIWWDFLLETKGTMGPAVNPINIMKNLFLADLKPTYDVYRDYRPFTHTRAIHVQGAVAKVEFVLNDDDSDDDGDIDKSYYSGIFQSGAPHGIIRLSAAMGLIPGLFVPGIGLKFFRNGIHSGDLIFAGPKIQVDGFNFFENDQLSHFHNVAVTLGLGIRFAPVDMPFTHVGSADVAMYDSSGTKTETNENEMGDNFLLSFPYEVVMKPSLEIQEMFGAPSTRQGFIDAMEQIPESTVLYVVYARHNSGDGFDVSDLKKIGFLRTTSEVIFSANADQYLFFQHNRMSTDMELGEDEWSGDIICPYRTNK